jgi:hypothetical protein
VAVPILNRHFSPGAGLFQDDHWLVRRSILAALVELKCTEELLEVCIQSVQGEDIPVQEASVSALWSLAGSPQQDAALSYLRTFWRLFITQKFLG